MCALPPPRNTISGTVSVSVCTHCARSASMRLFASGISAFAMRTASPKAAICGIGSVPERSPSSCPPPRMCAGSFSPCRIYSAPMPLGAWTLWPLTDIMSAPSVLAENGSFIKPCTASVCNSTLDFAARSVWAMPAMSVTAPVSLLTIMSVTSAVSSRSAARTASADIAPVLSGERSVIS